MTADFTTGLYVGAGSVVALVLFGLFLWWQIRSHGALPEEVGGAEYGLGGELVDAYKCVVDGVKRIAMACDESKIAVQEVAIQMFKETLRLLAERRRDESQIRRMLQSVTVAFKRSDAVVEVLERFSSRFSAQLEARYHETLLKLHARALLSTSIADKDVAEDVLFRQYLNALKRLLTEPDVIRLDGAEAWAKEVDTKLGAKTKVAA